MKLEGRRQARLARMSGFVYQDRYLEQLKNLTDQELGRLVRALSRYHMSGEVQELKGPESMAYDFIRYEIDETRNIKRTSKEVAEWRNEVLARDSYKCVRCGSTDRLNVHHIQPWKDNPDLRIDVQNGITLCEQCHKDVHSLMSKLNRENEE